MPRSVSFIFVKRTDLIYKLDYQIWFENVNLIYKLGNQICFFENRDRGMQVPEYVGCPRDRLEWLVVNHIAKMKARAEHPQRGNRALPSQRDMSQLRDELSSKRWSLALYPRVLQRKGSRGLQFHADPKSGRFDFVEESMDGLWTYDASLAPCRPVVHVRGFLCVTVAEPVVFADGISHSFFAIAVARNLVPHKESTVLPTGDPVHPTWSVLHNLWDYARQV